ncbi:MAG: hypothetical protein JSS91_14430 [Bacteroidetes bacterium]|nr:hypothetical protein [Bacteroidota bacterium]
MEKFASVIGGINIDIKGTAFSEINESGSYPGEVFISPGGVARNVSENLARLGIDVKLFGCVGDDHFGNLILNETASAGVDTDYIIKAKGMKTSAYLSAAGSNKDFFYAVNDMQNSMELITPLYLKQIQEVLGKSSLIVLDTNPDAEFLNEAVRFANEKNIPVFIDTVSDKKALKVSDISGKIDYLSPNNSEFVKLFGDYRGTGELEKKLNEGKFDNFSYILLKKDKEGADVICSAEKIIYHTDALNTAIKEVSGAGDAFNAGFIFSIIESGPGNADVVKAAWTGSCAASFALKSFRSVSEDLTKESLTELYNIKFK